MHSNLRCRGIQYYLKVIQCFILTHFYFRTNGSQHTGIIDGDTFNKNLDNAQLILYPRQSKSFTIKKGTPICQIIPFRREEWVATYQLRSYNDFVTNLSHHTTQHEPIPQNRTMEESEPLLGRDGTKFKSGGYRKNGMWKPKGKYFSEESPPPECPMHKGEDDVS